MTTGSDWIAGLTSAAAGSSRGIRVSPQKLDEYSVAASAAAGEAGTSLRGTIAGAFPAIQDGIRVAGIWGIAAILVAIVIGLAIVAYLASPVIAALKAG